MRVEIDGVLYVPATEVEPPESVTCVIPKGTRQATRSHHFDYSPSVALYDPAGTPVFFPIDASDTSVTIYFGEPTPFEIVLTLT